MNKLYADVVKGCDHINLGDVAIIRAKFFQAEYAKLFQVFQKTRVE